MATSRMVQARVPADIQDIASKIIQESGLTVSDVIRVLMTRIAKDKRIPAILFQPNAETLAAFAAIERGEAQTVTLDALQAMLGTDG